MIADEDLDETTIQDALRILNDLQTGLSVPYKQRKQIGGTPTERQAKKMLKDMHVLEVQCLEVAAIAYHFGRKCKLYKSELEQVRASPELQDPASELHDLAQKHRQSLVADALQGLATQVDLRHLSELHSLQTAMQDSLHHVSEVVNRLDHKADMRSEDLKTHVSKGFSHIERLLKTKQDETDSIAALSVRESLLSHGINDREIDLALCRSAYIEVRPAKKVYRNAGIQTLDFKPQERKVTIQTTKKLHFDSFYVEINGKTAPELSLWQGTSLKIKGEKKHQSSLRQIESPIRREKQVFTAEICEILPAPRHLEIFNCVLPAIFPRAKQTDLWTGDTLEILPETSGHSVVNPFNVAEEEVDSETQTLTPELSLQTAAVLSLASAEKHLSVSVCEPVSISSWSLLEVFAFSTEDSVKDDGETTPRRRPRRKVVRKDPIEEFFMLTLQAAKLNQPQRENVPKVDAEGLYRRAIQEGIPFNRWSEWLHQILRMSGQKTPR